jgi:tmRNA-binding protein
MTSYNLMKLDKSHRTYFSRLLDMLYWSLLSSHEDKMFAQHKTELKEAHINLKAKDKWLLHSRMNSYFSHQSQFLLKFQ